MIQQLSTLTKACNYQISLQDIQVFVEKVLDIHKNITNSEMMLLFSYSKNIQNIDNKITNKIASLIKKIEKKTDIEFTN
jgi:hypothetical protein